MQTVKYALVKVVVDHDEKTDPDEVVLRGELVSDIKGGYIEKSTIVDVMTEEDLKDEEES
jgi:hypothetical protein